jgi:regulation of enolase protein 1 (concanavalin A-like superfamily)
VATNATLTWTSSGATSYDIAFGTTNPPPAAATGLTAASYAPAGMLGGTTYFWQVTGRNSVGATTGPVWSFTTASNANALPSPWLNADVGAVGLTGSASYQSGTFTVNGAGSNIGGGSDSFQFVYQTLSGDGQIVARVKSVQNTNKNAEAGVMIRDTLDPGSREATIAVLPGGSVAFVARGRTGGGTRTVATATQAVPAWLRLVRTGSTITASVSTDGVAWQPVGTTTVSMGTAIYVGLAVSSHSTTLLNTSVFDSVTVNP